MTKTEALTAALVCMEAMSPSSISIGRGQRITMKDDLAEAKEVVKLVLVDELLNEVEKKVLAEYAK